MTSYRFGPFRLMPAQRRLECDGRSVVLAAKTFDLLVTLVLHRERALSKDDILDLVWPGTVVEEGNLAQQIFLLRRALAGAGDCITTLPGYGYRFSADVLEEAGAAVARQGRTHTLRWRGQDFLLRDGANVLGRANDVDVQIPLPTLSRRHACLVVNDHQATVEDLGSRNGTWLRGERLRAPTPLISGDELRLGSATAVYRLVLVTDSTQALERPAGDHPARTAALRTPAPESGD